MQNHEKRHLETAQKNNVLSYFFRVKTLPKSSSCVGVVTISRKGPKNADYLTVHF